MSDTVRMEPVGDRVIVFTRTFRAAPELVFRAWTAPELLTRWYGARGWRLVECEVDLRVGGRYRFRSRGPGGAEMVQQGVYREVLPPRRLVFTERFDDQSYPGESVITHEFAAESADRTTVTSTIEFPSAQARERVLRYPMARGLREGYQRLDRVLAKTTTSEGWTDHELDA